MPTRAETVPTWMVSVHALPPEAVEQRSALQAVQTAFRMPGVFLADHLFTFGRNLTFLQDEAFIRAFMAANPALVARLPYDPIRDFTPISVMMSSPLLLMITPSLPVNNIPELIAYARANPGKLNFGSGGFGTTPHISGELFRMLSFEGIGPAAMLPRACAGTVGRTAIFEMLVVNDQIREALRNNANLDALRQVARQAGFGSFRRATQTPFNLVFEAYPKVRDALASLSPAAAAAFDQG